MTDRAPVPEGRASFQRTNDESRKRMARLFATLTPAQTAILTERPALLDRSIHRLEHFAAIDLALTHGG